MLDSFKGTHIREITRTFKGPIISTYNKHIFLHLPCSLGNCLDTKDFYSRF